jgi:2-keto-4-pentenoate hydratase
MARTSRYSSRAGRQAASRGADAALKLPVNSVAPAITGTATEGETLTCSSGTWSNTPDTYGYQWNRDGVAIIGATAATRDLDEDDVGAVMTCTVKATNLGVSAVATSAGTDEVSAA